jgi:ATP-dependent Clp protease ATP-binding subunit ClpA
MYDPFENLKGLIVGRIPRHDSPPDFRVDLENECVYVRFARTLTTAEIARYADGLRKHPEFKESWSEIVDLRSVEDFQITPDETIALADTIDPFSLSSRRAFIVANDLQFHSARMQQVLRSPSKSIGIFENMADAERWVHTRVPPTHQAPAPRCFRSRSDLRLSPTQPHESAPPPRESAVKSGADVSANLVPVKPLCPLIGRTAELDRILHILGCRNGKNPVLVGELGVGKRTIVGGLAQRISEGYVPSFLIEKTVLELDLPPWDAIGSAWFDKFHSALPRAAQAGAILVVDELHTPIDGIFGRNSSHLQEILKRAKSVADHGLLEDCFQPVHVHPGTEADTADVLRGIKNI